MERQTQTFAATAKPIACSVLLALVLSSPLNAEDAFGWDQPLAKAPIQQSLAPYMPLANEIQSAAAERIGAEWLGSIASFDYLSRVNPAEVDEKFETLKHNDDFIEWWKNEATQQTLYELYAIGQKEPTLSHMSLDQFKQVYLTVRLADDEEDFAKLLEKYKGDPTVQFCLFWITCGTKYPIPKDKGKGLVPLSAYKE